MTRKGFNRTLLSIFRALGLVLVVALLAKLYRYLPWADKAQIEFANDVYAYLREMAPVFIALIAAYLAGVFRRRSNFTESLEEEWRNIVRTKSALWSYFEKPYPASDDYIAVFARLSETIDTMRIVYSNVGESRDVIGLYPFEPLHDMRRVLQAMDPRVKSSFTPAERKRARDCVTQSFQALRENFLEELELQEPDNPLLIAGARRLKVSGKSKRAIKQQERQRERHNKKPVEYIEVDAYLAGLYAVEMQAREAAAATPIPSLDGNRTGV